MLPHLTSALLELDWSRKGHCLSTNLLGLRLLWFRYQLNALEGKDSSGTCETVLPQTQHLYLLPRRWLTTSTQNMGLCCCRRWQVDASAKRVIMEGRENCGPLGLSLTQVGGFHVGGLLLEQGDNKDTSTSQSGCSDAGGTRQIRGLQIGKKLQLGATRIPSWPSS